MRENDPKPPTTKERVDKIESRIECLQKQIPPFERLATCIDEGHLYSCIGYTYTGSSSNKEMQIRWKCRRCDHVTQKPASKDEEKAVEILNLMRG
jgi:hypothetical protein